MGSDGCRTQSEPNPPSDTTPDPTPDPGPGIPEVVPWVPDVLTQPVPSWGSKLRLSLPTTVDNLALPYLGGFGAHAGGHVEGLDHIWLEMIQGQDVRSWASGTVTQIDDWGPYGNDGLHEYAMIIDFGQGLIGKHAEVAQCLVKVGDKVEEGQVIAQGLPFGPYHSAEFFLTDLNRRDGIRSGQGSSVSPFDYLNAKDKAALIERYQAEVVEPIFKQGKEDRALRPWEPALTNPVLIHRDHKGTAVGEWILADRGWSTPDPVYYDILVLLDVQNAYGTFKRLEAQDDDFSRPGFKFNASGSWVMEGNDRIHFFLDGGQHRYARFQVDESSGRAQLRFAWRTDAYPETLDGAALYLERAPLPRRLDAENIGVLKGVTGTNR